MQRGREDDKDSTASHKPPYCLLGIMLQNREEGPLSYPPYLLLIAHPGEKSTTRRMGVGEATLSGSCDNLLLSEGEDF